MARGKRAAAKIEGPPARQDPRNVLRVGFDFGTNTSVLAACEGDMDITISPDIIPTVVGYPKPGILPRILPKDKNTLFGNEALDYRLHLNLHWPIDRGYVVDLEAAKDFVKHIRELLDPAGEKELWAVVGCPASGTPDKLRDLRSAVSEAFSRILLVPEPFLAAMGYRDESRLGDEDYQDPTKNSLFVDIGAGTTDLCKIQGYYPGPEDQINLTKAGNDIDIALAQGIKRTYPDTNITRVSITRLKEENSFVGTPVYQVLVTIPVNGKPRQIDITNQVKSACESIMDDIIWAIEEIVARCDSDSVEGLLSNIILTGGGSLIKNICLYLEKRLKELGYEAARVRKVEDYKRLVARGALKTAKRVRDEQWQIPVR